MSLESEWAMDMGSTAITIEPYAAVNDYGEPSYGTGVVYQAIVQKERRNITFPDGRVEQSRAVLFVLSSSAAVSLQDRITFAGSTAAVRILDVNPVDDDTGQHHVEVDLG